MEVARHPFYSFTFDKPHALLSFLWTERTSEMTDADFQEALRAYARFMVELRARRGLIDVRRFRARPSEAMGPWRTKEIVPLYHQAGLEKFAYVLPAGAQVPPEHAPGEAYPGEKFLTKQFGSEQAAIAWLTAEP